MLDFGNIREILRLSPMKAYFFSLIALLAACSNGASNNEAGNQQITGETVRNPTALVLPGSEKDRPSRPTSALDEQSRQAARQTLQRYFALVLAGQSVDAAKLWKDRSRGAAFTARLQRLDKFQTNIAAAQPGDSANGSAHVDISLQLLRETSSGLVSLSDGTAVLRRAKQDLGASSEPNSWLIDHIGLQPPPVPLAS